MGEPNAETAVHIDLVNAGNAPGPGDRVGITAESGYVVIRHSSLSAEQWLTATQARALGQVLSVFASVAEGQKPK